MLPTLRTQETRDAVELKHLAVCGLFRLWGALSAAHVYTAGGEFLWKEP